MIISKGTVSFDLSPSYYECLQLACSYIFKQSEAYVLTSTSLTMTGKYHLQTRLFLPFLLYFIKEYGTLLQGRLLIKRNSPNGMFSYGEVIVENGDYSLQPFFVGRLRRTYSFDEFHTSLSHYRPEDYQTHSPELNALLDSWCYDPLFHSFSFLSREIKRIDCSFTLLVGNEILHVQPENKHVDVLPIDRHVLPLSSFDNFSPNQRYLDFFKRYSLDLSEQRTLSYNGKTVPLFEPIMWLLQEAESTCNQCIHRLKRITTGCEFCLPKRTTH